jgi:uncharacterized protein (DUF2267 family)
LCSGLGQRPGRCGRRRGRQVAGWFARVDAGQARSANQAGWWCAMNQAELLQQVQAAAALDRATAERVILATMVTLAERLSDQELARLSPWLPDRLQAAVHAGSPACQPFDADEFVDRVAEHVGVQPQVAWTQVRAVLGTLDRDVAELQALRQRLPREFDALMA